MVLTDAETPAQLYHWGAKRTPAVCRPGRPTGPGRALGPMWRRIVGFFDRSEIQEIVTRGLIGSFPCNGVITANRVILKTGHTANVRQACIADLCENGKTYQPDTGFIGGFVAPS